MQVLSSFGSNALGKGTMLKNQCRGRRYAVTGAAGTMSEVRWYGTLGVGGMAGTVRGYGGYGTRGAAQGVRRVRANEPYPPYPPYKIFRRFVRDIVSGQCSSGSSTPIETSRAVTITR